MIGTFLLWALVYLHFLPIYSPLEPVGPQKPCVTPLRGSRRRRGLGQLLLPGLLPGWLGWPYQTPATAHPAPCQPLWRAAPGLICRAGEEDSYQVVGSYTFLVSEGCIGCLP